MTEEKSFVYIFVEYNASWIYGGWHFYLAPIENGVPNRARDKSVWLGRYHWMQDRVLETLGIPLKQGETQLHGFMKQYPNGALLWSDPEHRHFERVAAEDSKVELWNCFRVVREDRERQWLDGCNEKE